MEKLELKHIVGYLPYELKVFACYNQYELELEEDCSSETISVRETIDNLHKPILRPLSDLTKEIEVNGENFVPIIELFQIAFGGSYTIKDVLIKSDKGKIYISTSISKLCFYPKTKCFEFFEIDFEGNGYSPVTNQLEMFEKLYEWHFDIHDLIGKSLAIDINTLNK